MEVTSATIVRYISVRGLLSSTGFQIRGRFNGFVKAANDLLYSRNAHGHGMGRRNEPVTYWIRVGDKVVRGQLNRIWHAFDTVCSGKSQTGCYLGCRPNPDSARAYLQSRSVYRSISFRPGK